MTEDQEISPADFSGEPEENLSHEERMLVILREELYEGSWEFMVEDLEDRLEGRPYIFKLQNRIEDDLERIEKLKKIEESNDINLADYIEELDDKEEME